MALNYFPRRQFLLCAKILMFFGRGNCLCQKHKQFSPGSQRILCMQSGTILVPGAGFAQGSRNCCARGPRQLGSRSPFSFKGRKTLHTQPGTAGFLEPISLNSKAQKKNYFAQGFKDRQLVSPSDREIVVSYGPGHLRVPRAGLGQEVCYMTLACSES